MSKILKREDVKLENTWALNDIFTSDEQWESELSEVINLCDELASYEGQLTTSADKLYNFLLLEEKADILFGRVYIYANQALHVDMNNSKYQDFSARANTCMIKLKSSTAFSIPELLSTDEATIQKFISERPELKLYETKFNRIFREKSHTLSKSEETLLAEVDEITNAAGDIFSLFANADLKFEKIMSLYFVF